MALKAGITSSEFWLQLVKLVLGCAMIYFGADDFVRAVGAGLTGHSAAGSTEYTRARTQLKRESLANEKGNDSST